MANHLRHPASQRARDALEMARRTHAGRRVFPLTGPGTTAYSVLSWISCSSCSSVASWKPTTQGCQRWSTSATSLRRVGQSPAAFCAP